MVWTVPLQILGFQQQSIKIQIAVAPKNSEMCEDYIQHIFHPQQARRGK